MRKEKITIEQAEYLSVEQCAKMLGLSTSTVYQMLREDRIEGAFRVNKCWRIPVVSRKDCADK